ncbi:MAG TPA: hypothetical protein PKK00_04940 [Bacteroidales bacterium]|nr:hypothetical protein [Bacteroidales bacterium]HPS16705.1 hypothetical protein [Bacteroidales bacterium]
MISQRKDRINSIVAALIIGFFLLLSSSFTDKSVNSQSNFIQNEVNCSGNVNAIVSDAIQLPSCPKFYLPVHPDLFNDVPNVFNDNSNADRDFIFLQKIQLTENPFAIKFYYHLFSNDDDDLPVLS